MLKRFHATYYMELARHLAMLEELIAAGQWGDGIANKLANLATSSPVPDRSTMVRSLLGHLKTGCENTNLSLSALLIEDCLKDLPKTGREFRMLYNQIKNEMGRELYLHVPQDRAKFWEQEDCVSDQVWKAFPGPAAEMRSAGNCYAAALHTACVFHSMRAAEIGVRALANALGVTFEQPIELTEMGSIIEKIEAAIKGLKGLPRGKKKDEDLHFYSQAAAQFRYFKDGWRIRVAHGRETYEQAQALSALTHVRDFFEVLAPRLSELSSDSEEPNS